MELKILKKAYELNLSKLSEGFTSSEIVVFAESLGKAKTKLLKEVRYDDWVLSHTGESLNYLNIPVVRRKCDDKVDFEGMEVSRDDISEILKKRERMAFFQSLIDNKNITHCYIRKRGSYYRSNYCGYTSLMTEAGVYEKEDAISHARSCDELHLEPVDNLAHNEMISNKIEELRNKLLILPIK